MNHIEHRKIDFCVRGNFAQLIYCKIILLQFKISLQKQKYLLD